MAEVSHTEKQIWLYAMGIYHVAILNSLSYLPDEKSRGKSSAGPRVRLTYTFLETEQSSRQCTTNSIDIKPSRIYDSIDIAIITAQ